MGIGVVLDEQGNLVKALRTLVGDCNGTRVVFEVGGGVVFYLAEFHTVSLYFGLLVDASVIEDVAVGEECA